MIQKLKTQDFDNVYRLMEQSFPPDERRTYTEQKSLLSNPQYCIYILPDTAASNIKAFLAVWTFKDFVFIEHFAVNPLYRNSGIGSAMLKEAVQQIPYMVCLEVELPVQETAKRRIGFYERNGFFLNHYPYMQPPISDGRSPIPLLIMTNQNAISENRFQEIKNTLYKNVYHAADSM